MLFNLYTVNLEELSKVINSDLVIVFKGLYCKGTKVFAVGFLQVIVLKLIYFVLKELKLYKFFNLFLINVIRLCINSLVLSILSFINLCPNV